MEWLTDVVDIKIKMDIYSLTNDVIKDCIRLKINHLFKLQSAYISSKWHISQ